MKKEIPYFIQQRGCVNCNAYSQRTSKAPHELVVLCMIRECRNYGFSIFNPFVDPQEIINYLKEKKIDDNLAKINAGRYINSIKKKFWRYYERLGISLDSLLENI